MNILLIFFALPIATIIIAAVLEKWFGCPIAIASLIFAIYLIVAFAVFDASFLIFVLVYTVLAYISAVITRLIINILSETEENRENCNNNNNTNVINNNGNGTCQCMRCCCRR